MYCILCYHELVNKDLYIETCVCHVRLATTVRNVWTSNVVDAVRSELSGAFGALPRGKNVAGFSFIKVDKSP